MAFGESWIISVMMRFTSNGSRVMRARHRRAGSGVEGRSRDRRDDAAAQRIHDVLAHPGWSTGYRTHALGRVVLDC
jgi:hypothetical protein